MLDAAVQLLVCAHDCAVPLSLPFDQFPNITAVVHPSTPRSQSRVTRRTFLKRSGVTAIGVALALHSFRSEAVAEESGGSSVPTKYVLQTTQLATEYECITNVDAQPPDTYTPKVERDLEGGESPYWYKDGETVGICVQYAGTLVQTIYIVEFTVKSRPLDPFTESIFPDPYAIIPEYGLFSSAFTYSWECVAEMELKEVWQDQNGNQEIEDDEPPLDIPLAWTILQEIGSQNATGTVSVNHDTGVKTLDPPTPIGWVLAEGLHPQLHFFYRLTSVNSASSFEMKLEIWQPRLNPAYGNIPDPLPDDYWIAPPPGQPPSVQIDLSDAFYYAVRPYESWN